MRTLYNYIETHKVWVINIVSLMVAVVSLWVLFSLPIPKGNTLSADQVLSGIQYCTNRGFGSEVKKNIYGEATDVMCAFPNKALAKSVITGSDLK